MNLREIANLAGVSSATVSLVLNNKKGVGYAKRREIAQLLAENGYSIAQTSVSDRALNRNIRFLKYVAHTKLVNDNPGFVSTIIDAIESECRKNKYELVISNVNSVDGLRKQVLESQSSGFLLLGTELADEDIDILSEAVKPIVIVDNDAARLNCPAITMNNKAAVFSAVKHLYDLGHRHIGFLSNLQPSSNCEARRSAYIEAVHQAGLTELVYPVNMTMDGAHDSVEAMLKRGEQFPSAIIANNDSIAIGAICAFKQAGLSVPEDISVVGFDDIPFSKAFSPSLTTVSVPCAAIGEQSVDMLIKLINNPSSIPTKEYFGTKLIVRGSTIQAGTDREHRNLMKS